jgi:DNA mismatch repair protein MutS
MRQRSFLDPSRDPSAASPPPAPAGDGSVEERPAETAAPVKRKVAKAKGARKGAGKAGAKKGGKTPMMEQFWKAKKDAPDAILFFRMGDFYELFHDDAVTAARELGITLTSRSKGEDAFPMAGVPVKAAEGYVLRLVQKGYRVAICEQLTDPRKTKGIVERGVVRVVTPGTLTEENALEARANNYLAGLYCGKETAGIAWVDVSTGRFQVLECPLEKAADEVARIGPAELLWPPSTDEEHAETALELRRLLGPRVGERDEWRFERGATTRALERHFGVATLEGFGIEPDSAVIPAAGALVEYLEETQRSACEHVRRLERVEPDGHLVLDRATRTCLELTETQRGGRREGTLLDTIDETQTPMGGRLLREWLLSPLRDVDAILHRQRAVAELVEEPFLREELRGILDAVLDVERLVAKVATGRANGRDLVALASSTGAVPALRARLESVGSKLLGELRERLDPLEDVTARIAGTLVDAPPIPIKEGGLIREGVDEELDELHRIQGDGKSWMARFQADEIERTGLPGLKIGFNSVFGYYLEVPRGQADRVPEEYIRKQTIKTAERYVTPELKEYETKVLKAEERSKDLEYELFTALREDVAKELGRILDTARAIAEVDVLAGLAETAHEHRYRAPDADDGDQILVVEGRHPVIEVSDAVDSFVPNDTHLDRSERNFVVLTGPNMAGKSTYIRQVALIVLLAQVGSFVPAAEARVGVVDRIFTRVGAGDDISRGASTFMVEMVEIANILNNATDRSLVVLDEVGRGTSTFDGLALAWAIVEHVHGRIGARALFATHYHQLTDLADRHTGVVNQSVAVREWGEEIVFLHKIVEGGTDRSYGIHVARLAGVPADLLERARAILGDLERDEEDLARRIASRDGAPEASEEARLYEPGPSAVERRLAELDPDALSPIDALLALRELKAATKES